MKVRHRRTTGLLVSMAAVASTLAVLAPAAAAKPRLELEWGGFRDVHVGLRIDLDWSQHGTAAELPGARFIVQEARPAGGYRTIIGRLKQTGPQFGEATLPAHQVLGRYRYRLAMILKGKVIAQKKVTIGVFGHLPLSSLFADQSTALGAGLYVFPGGQFRYTASVPITAAGEQTLFTVAPYSCTAIHLEFLVGGSKLTIKLSDLQRGRIEEHEVAPGDTAGKFEDDYVVDEPWSLTAEATETGFSVLLYLNGWVDCDTEEPFETARKEETTPTRLPATRPGAKLRRPGGVDGGDGNFS
jgi:hypothetical protein